VRSSPRVSSHVAPTPPVELFRHQLAASGLAPGERCLAITDSQWDPACAAACVAAARALGAEADQVVLPADRPVVTSALAPAVDAHLVVYMTSFTLHYRPEIRAALDAGARVLAAMQAMPVLRRLPFDPEVRRRVTAGAALLDPARTIRITSAAGTDLVMDKTGRRALAHYGAADRPGQLDFWTAGMVQAAQLEGTLEGRLVLDTGDCCFRLERFVDEPATIVFERGRAVAVEGGRDAVLIRAEIEAGDDEAACLAGHMAWGMDARAEWGPQVFKSPDGGGAHIEAFDGNVQIEIGSNDDVAFGGRNRTAVHLGLCLRHASLWLDGTPVITDGRFVPESLQPHDDQGRSGRRMTCT
jgi:2,5-dihydroxypyridine 5,6-dioxygenase